MSVASEMFNSNQGPILDKTKTAISNILSAQI